jgi:hypothetical protein
LSPNLPFFLGIITILTSVRWCIIVVLIFIFLINDFEHFHLSVNNLYVFLCVCVMKESFATKVKVALNSPPPSSASQVLEL